MTEEEKQVPTTTPPPLQDMLQGILSNPEILQKVGGILGAMSPAPPTSTAASHDLSAESTEIRQSQPVLSTSVANGDGLAGLLSDPAMLEKLPQIMAVLKPLVAAGGSPTQVSKQSPSPQRDRDNLLLALKPFLSAERRDAVDLIMRLSGLGNVFRQLK